MIHYRLIIYSIFFCTSVLVILSGCQSLKYYNQAVCGQIKILNNRQPIKELINDENIGDELKKNLNLIMEIREFASKDLELPVEDNYLTYVDLKRQYVVWNVFVTPEFSLTPQKWCYPVIGCASYRGFFSIKDATDFADKLRHQGYDVYIGGVSAYSTLGWFDDPVLSSFIFRSPPQLAALIFHEAAHKILYIADDTTFNESFATAVEQEGIHRWLISQNNIQDYDEYIIEKNRHHQFVQLITKHQANLNHLYSKNISMSEKRNEKRRAFEKIKKDYINLKEEWLGYAGYDFWFSNNLNNAKLITVSTYHDLVPSFVKLLDDSENDLGLFFEKCKILAKKPKNERDQILKSILLAD